MDVPTAWLPPLGFEVEQQRPTFEGISDDNAEES
jgi:hypothetical protein